LLKEIVITYPKVTCKNLKKYVGERRGIVFVTRSKKPVMINLLASSFSRAGVQGNIPFKMFYVLQQGPILNSKGLTIAIL
jgi:hypothetical protein